MNFDVFMDRVKYQKNLGKHIARVRFTKGLTVTQLADLCGKDRQSIERLEKGDVNPSAYFLFQVASGLGVPVSRLFEF